MITIKDSIIKKNNSRLVVGYDLCRSFSQISWYRKADGEPQTVSTITGAEQFNIPAVLAKRRGEGQWLYGKDALKCTPEEGYILIDDLLYKAERGEDLIIEDDAYDPVALLTLFVKRSLNLLTALVPFKEIDALMFTVESLSPRTVEVLGRVVAALSLKCELITYQTHIESFYHYMLNQERELMRGEVMLFELTDYLRTMRLEVNYRTAPKVCLIYDKEYKSFTGMEQSDDERIREALEKKADNEFKSIVIDEIKGRDISTVYLLGDGFNGDWAKESLKILCGRRRVFKGNNLFSKGACFSAMDKLIPPESADEFVYLGDEKLKANVGLKLKRRGEESYFAALDAGSNWFEAASDFKIILETGSSITFIITPLTGGSVVQRTIELDGLPERQRATTRLSVHLEMADVNTLNVDIEDMGFGEIVKSSGLAWSHSIEL